MPHKFGKYKIYLFEKGITQGSLGEARAIARDPKADDGETLNQTSIELNSIHDIVNH